jgi:hypothetical protein
MFVLHVQLESLEWTCHRTVRAANLLARVAQDRPPQTAKAAMKCITTLRIKRVWRVQWGSSATALLRSVRTVLLTVWSAPDRPKRIV